MSSGKHFHNVLCLSEAKGMDIIMKNLRLREASVRDIDQIRTLYWRLLDSSPKYGQVLQWKKNIYPNDDDWNAYIVKGEMYLILQDVDSHIRVSMFDDRVEVVSPGGLPSGLTAEEYLSGKLFVLRNQKQVILNI